MLNFRLLLTCLFCAVFMLGAGLPVAQAEEHDDGTVVEDVEGDAMYNEDEKSEMEDGDMHEENDTNDTEEKELDEGHGHWRFKDCRKLRQEENTRETVRQYRECMRARLHARRNTWKENRSKIQDRRTEARKSREEKKQSFRERWLQRKKERRSGNRSDYQKPSATAESVSSRFQKRQARRAHAFQNRQARRATMFQQRQQRRTIRVLHFGNRFDAGNGAE